MWTTTGPALVHSPSYHLPSTHEYDEAHTVEHHTVEQQRQQQQQSQQQRSPNAATMGWQDGTVAWQPSRMVMTALPLAPIDYPLTPASNGPYPSFSFEAGRSPYRSEDPLAETRRQVDSWRHGKGSETLDLEGYDVDYGQPTRPYPMPDEQQHIIDLRFPVPQLDSTPLPIEGISARRQSVSTFSVSSCGPVVDVSAMDDPVVPGPERSTSMSEYASTTPTTTTTTTTTMTTMTAAVVEPVPASFTLASSQPHDWTVARPRTSSRGRASGSPRLNVHPAADVEGNVRQNCWSTGSVVSRSPHLPPSHVFPTPEAYQELAARHLSVRSSPVLQTPNLAIPLSPGHPPPPLHPLSHSHPHPHPHPLPLTHGHHPHPNPLSLSHPPRPHLYWASQPPTYHRSPTLYPPSPSAFLPPDGRLSLETPSPLPSHGYHRPRPTDSDLQARPPHLMRMDPIGPPDLFASLCREPSAPPPEDMNPADPELTPHEQDIRFDGDLYTPRWVRGQGNKREGWCGVCTPGRWLVLKNSAFWYDKSFSHGISAATGSPFQGPQDTRRMEGNPDVWEGRCGSCHDWVALVSSKKKGTTWFRHAYKVSSSLSSLSLTLSLSLSLFPFFFPLDKRVVDVNMK